MSETHPTARRLARLIQTRRYGIPDCPSCLAYDSKQQLLAVGSKNGTVIILGREKLKRHLVHPEGEEVLNMTFGGEKGLLVTLCSSGVMYVWSLRGRHPCIVCQRDVINHVVDSYVLLTWPSGSNCIYIGTAVSEVRSINITRPLESNTASYEQSTASSCEQSILASHRALPGQQQQQLPRESFTLPIYYRNDVFAGSAGKVVSIQQHPRETTWLLLAYSKGLCVLWDLTSDDQNTEPERKYTDITKDGKMLTSAWWIKGGEALVVAYSDGTLITFDTKTGKMKKDILNITTTSTHSTGSLTDTTSIDRIQGIKFANTQLMLFTRNHHKTSAPSEETDTSQLLSLWCWRRTVKRELPKLRQLKLNSSIVDFKCLLPQEGQEPIGLAVLTDQELLMFKVDTDKIYRSSDFDYARINLPLTDPHSPQEHHSTITHVQCYDDSNDSYDILEETLKAATNHTQRQAQNKLPWPLEGDLWKSRGLIVTGHEDGSVVLWLCYHESFVPTLTIFTSAYFKPNDTTQSISSSSLSIAWTRLNITQKTLLVGYKMGHVLLFKLSQANGNSIVKSQELILNQEGNEDERNWCIPGFQFTTDDSGDQNPSLRLLQHFCCYYTTGKVTSNNDRGSPHCEGTGTSYRTDSHVPTLEPIRATTAEYIEEFEMLLVGTDHGLVVMDTRNNVVTQMMATDSKLQRVARHGPNARGKPGNTDCTITVIETAYMKTVYPTPPTYPTVWVGTATGVLCAFSVITSDEIDKRIQLGPSILALEENTPLVNVVFLDEADLLSPQPSPQVERTGRWILIGSQLDETTVSTKLKGHSVKSYAIVSTANTIKVFRFPAGDESSLWKLPDSEDSTIVNISMVRTDGMISLVVRLSASDQLHMLMLPSLQTKGTVTSHHLGGNTELFSLAADGHGAFVSTDSLLQHCAVDTVGRALIGSVTEQ